MVGIWAAGAATCGLLAFAQVAFQLSHLLHLLPDTMMSGKGAVVLELLGVADPNGDSRVKLAGAILCPFLCMVLSVVEANELKARHSEGSWRAGARSTRLKGEEDEQDAEQGDDPWVGRIPEGPHQLGYSNLDPLRTPLLSRVSGEDWTNHLQPVSFPLLAGLDYTNTGTMMALVLIPCSFLVPALLNVPYLVAVLVGVWRWSRRITALPWPWVQAGSQLYVGTHLLLQYIWLLLDLQGPSTMTDVLGLYRLAPDHLSVAVQVAHLTFLHLLYILLGAHSDLVGPTREAWEGRRGPGLYSAPLQGLLSLGDHGEGAVAPCTPPLDPHRSGGYREGDTYPTVSTSWWGGARVLMQLVLPLLATAVMALAEMALAVPALSAIALCGYSLVHESVCAGGILLVGLWTLLVPRSQQRYKQGLRLGSGWWMHDDVVGRDFTALVRMHVGTGMVLSR